MVHLHLLISRNSESLINNEQNIRHEVINFVFSWIKELLITCSGESGMYELPAQVSQGVITYLLKWVKELLTTYSGESWSY